MKYSRDVVLLVSLMAGGFGVVVGVATEADPWLLALVGVAVSYLSAEFWDRFWRWTENTPKFMGWKYWVKQTIGSVLEELKK
jgi:hypothetical protein